MVANVTRLRTSHIQTTQDIFDLLKGPDPSYLVLIVGDNLSSRNQDMAQSVILYKWPWKVKVIREVKNILHCNPHTTHEHTCEVSLRSYW